MSLKKNAKFWQTLSINCAVFLICATALVTITIITQKQLPASADSQQTPLANQAIILHGDYVGEQFKTTRDNYFLWQIYQTFGDIILASWDDIYAHPENLDYDTTLLQITPYGLCYQGNFTELPNLHTTVNYQGTTCVLTFPGC